GDTAKPPAGDAANTPAGDTAKPPAGDAAKTSAGDTAEPPVSDTANTPPPTDAELEKVYTCIYEKISSFVPSDELKEYAKDCKPVDKPAMPWDDYATKLGVSIECYDSARDKLADTKGATEEEKRAYKATPESPSKITPFFTSISVHAVSRFKTKARGGWTSEVSLNPRDFCDDERTEQLRSVNNSSQTFCNPNEYPQAHLLTALHGTKTGILSSLGRCCTAKRRSSSSSYSSISTRLASRVAIRQSSDDHLLADKDIDQL
ncbi:hypothetical protein BGZ95_004019, partial [Linnemannia exigua]